jgi:UDP-glucose:(heptosyl)LPS alpha-1,3-glucosyltransferase
MPIKTKKELCFIREKSTKFGGAEMYLSRLSNSLTKSGIQHRVIHSIFPNFLPSWVRIIIFNMQVCITKRNKFYFSLERVVCPDIYRAGDGVHKVFLTVEKKSKINPLHPVYLFLERRCFNNAKRIIANSNLIKNEIINTYQIDPEKIIVVYNGIEIKENDYEKSYAKLSKEFNISKQHKVLLYVGSGFKRKGVSEFLEIISKLEDDNIRAFIIGKEKKIEDYKRLAKQLKVNHQVFFTGPREDVDDFYTIGHIFILPTHYEPFSNVILEAMSFKNVVFTTQQNGASEILEDEFIMKSSNDMSIVNLINKLFKDEGLLDKLMKHNQLEAKNFSIEKNLRKTLNVIEKTRDLY